MRKLPVAFAFRFHTGSIKRFVQYLWDRRRQTFRFHTGSIKSPQIPTDNPAYMYRFDSILVRLKESVFNINAKHTKRFRFHTGSIKRQMARPKPMSRQRFDSILVRLKAKYRKQMPQLSRCFDSILVRLKVKNT